MPGTRFQRLRRFFFSAYGVNMGILAVALLVPYILGFVPSIPYYFACGIGSTLLSQLICAENRERRRMLRDAIRHIQENRLWVLHNLVLFGVGALVLIQYQAPTESPALEVAGVIEVLGLVVIWYPVMKDVLAGHQVPLSIQIGRLTDGFAFWALTLLVIGSLGDSLMQAINEEPASAAAVVITLGLLVLIVRVTNMRTAAPLITERTSVCVRKRRPMSQRDRMHAAAHEAGHALTYAALEEIPDELEVRVNDHIDGDGVAGFITDVNSGHQLNDESFETWRMLMLLAGREGEIAMLGAASLGASSDNAKWIRHARQYLGNCLSHPFYPEPANEQEQEANNSAIVGLVTRQRLLLEEFFALNAGIHQELAQALLARQTMNASELRSYLEYVRFPERFPVPRTASRETAETWAALVLSTLRPATDIKP